MYLKKLEKIINGTNNEELLQQIFNEGDKFEKVLALKRINDFNFLSNILLNPGNLKYYKYIVIFKFLKTLIGEKFDINKCSEIFYKAFDDEINISGISVLSDYDSEKISEVLYKGYGGITHGREDELFCEYKKAMALSSESYTIQLFCYDEVSCYNFIKYIPDDIFIKILNNEYEFDLNVYDHIVNLVSRGPYELMEMFDKIKLVADRINESIFANIVERLDYSLAKELYINYCITYISDKELLKRLSTNSVSWYTKLIALAKLEGRLED